MSEPEEIAGQEETSRPAAEGAPETAAVEEVAQLRQLLEEERRKAAENYDQYVRSVAELRNYKKRVEQEREQMARQSNAGLLANLLPIVDDFERAMSVLPDEKLLRFTWIEGIALIYRRLRSVLEQAGLRAIDAQGQPFDPYFHEAILYEEVPPEQDGIVLADLQKGYKLYDRVLRPTLVKVGKAVAAPPASEEVEQPETTPDKTDEQDKE